MYPVYPEMIHRNNPKHKIFRFNIQSEMATETEFKTLVLCGHGEAFVFLFNPNQLVRSPCDVEFSHFYQPFVTIGAIGIGHIILESCILQELISTKFFHIIAK